MQDHINPLCGLKGCLNDAGDQFIELAVPVDGTDHVVRTRVALCDVHFDHLNSRTHIAPSSPQAFSDAVVQQRATAA